MSKIRQRYDDEFRKNAVRLSCATTKTKRSTSWDSPQHDLSLAEDLCGERRDRPQSKETAAEAAAGAR